MPAILTCRFPETDLLRGAARSLIEAEQARLPDLSAVTVLLPNLHAAPALARALGLEAGLPTLLLPALTTLPQLAKRASLDLPSLPDSERQSLLYGALRARKWFHDATLLWPLTAELLKLFDELTLNQVRLPDSHDDFLHQLETAYAATAGASLQFEARLAHELWHALRHDLGARLDAASTYALQLGQLAQTANAPLYGVGLTDLAPVERDFLTAYAGRTQVTLFTSETLSEDASSNGALLRAAWGFQGAGSGEREAENPKPLFERALILREAVPASPVAGKLKLFGAQSLEEEAFAAATQIRLWLAEGKRDIAIVAQDRLAARRLRALLERHAIYVKDETGWTFSTTAASALIMRWLDLVADDFYYQHLLDFLKSPLVLSQMPREERREAVSALELLIREHNVVSRLAHYLDLARRNDALACMPLLEALNTARTGWQTRRAQPLRDWLKLLTSTLSQLGMLEPLARDLAGGQMLDMLARSMRELETSSETFRFAEWRHWLNQCFERATFLDTGIESSIVFTHLPATRLRAFDAALLLGCDARHLPSPPAATVFFNQSVRASLNLPTWRDAWLVEQGDVAGLLARSGAVLATWQAFQQGEPNLLSPWFELLDTCHTQAYGVNLRDTQLRSLLELPPIPAPDLAQAQPAPRLDTTAIPQEISASAYGSLMICPYQYFARHVLKLNELDEVQLTLEKRDFGSIVHHILHRFHHDHPALGDEPDAHWEAVLRDISRHVFAPMLRINYLSRAWLAQWEKLIPAYLAWQREHEAQGWQWHSGEAVERLALTLTTGAPLTLKGTLDRLDEGGNGRTVIDYKMKAKGDLRKQLKLPGEDVQLPVYALLAGGRATAAAYLSFHQDTVETVQPEGDIQELAADVAQRLQAVFEALHAGAGLPAQGTEAACALCEMEGVCRRSYWNS
ncbi:MAG: PD-(D/E)XK nuclease family protein [Hydrogenophilales bacterium]|nr:PD-(D/E)XK nuclease family protein [Hydrogenophilales bacterium]